MPPEHLARHPFGRIPVLSHSGFLLYETGAICRYVDEAFDGPSLQPSSTRARARMAQIIGLLDAYCYRPMVWGVFVQRVRVPLRGGAADEQQIAGAMPAVEKGLDALASLQDNGAFLAGDQLTLADTHAYPMLKYLSLAPEGRSAMARRPALQQWLERMQARPSAAQTRTEYEQVAE